MTLSLLVLKKRDYIESIKSKRHVRKNNPVIYFTLNKYMTNMSHMLLSNVCPAYPRNLFLHRM